MTNKKIFLAKSGSFNINLSFLPKTTYSQLKFKYKQQLKKSLGGLSEHWLKHNPQNRNSCLDSTLITLNSALNLFHARQLIKSKLILINKKRITSPHYRLKPFSTISVNTQFNELTLLNIIKNQNTKNCLSLLNGSLLVAFKIDKQS